jgi:glycosyltransferase involved in cell wall biosynthesis
LNDIVNSSGQPMTKLDPSPVPGGDGGTSLDLSVVICTYNRSSLLVRALESLEFQEPADLAYEVLVVDNNSSDDTRNVAQHFVEKRPPRFRYIFEPKQGLSYARNAGIANARAEDIAFTDDDVRSWIMATNHFMWIRLVPFR